MTATSVVAGPRVFAHRRGHAMMLASNTVAVMLQRNSSASTVELLSTVEIAGLLGVSRQRVDKLSRSPNFPRSIATLAIGRVWERTDIVTWAKQTGRLPADFEA